MNLSSRQLSLLLIISLAICGFSYWWYKYRTQLLTQEQLFNQIESAYSRQFCGVVFPNLKKCVTAAAEECPTLVQAAIGPCFAGLKNYIPSVVSKAELRETHDRVAECFAMNMHEQIMRDYLIKSEECRALMQ